MTTNRDWLFSLPLEEQYAWMNAERTESPTSETMQHIGQVIENTIKRGVYGDTAAQNADSRDKLEADARKIADAYNMDSQRHGTERFAHELYYSIIHLLDRQRALSYEVCDECSKEYYELQDEVEELQMQVDTLKSRHCPHYHVNEHTCDVHETRIAELTAERDNLADDLLIANKQREWYRKKFGKCLDYADAIHALMDEGMA